MGHAGRWVRFVLFCSPLILFLGMTAVSHAKSLEDELQAQKQYQKQNSPLTTRETFSRPQKIYFAALELEKKGKLAGALVKLSDAYGEESILTDSYYRMLDKKRRSILKNIENGSPWFPGAPDQTKIVQSIRKQFHALNSRPDSSIYHVPADHSLPLERFLNYEILQATQKRPPVDCLNSSDPWMVSAILFLAGKGELSIRPEGVIRRWERRPDLWDGICTRQAILYLGTLKPDKLKTLHIENKDIKMGVQSLMDAAEKSLLLDCASHFNPSRHLLLVDMSVKEAVSYESLGRVEISIRNVHGKEFFRAMNNRSSQCAPIPPNAFGIFPVGEKKQPELKDVKSAGMEANITNTTKYGSLMTGCKASTEHGILKIRWKIKAESWSLPDNKAYLFVKIVPRGEKDAPWIFCSSPICNMQSVQTDDRRLATVKPLLCLTKSDCREARQDNIGSLVTAKAQRRHEEMGGRHGF